MANIVTVPLFKTRNLAVNIDSGARTVLPGTNITFSTDPVTGDITINAPAPGLGTVTSVGATGSTGLAVGGSPITTAGVLTFTLSANLQAWSGVTVASKADLNNPIFTGDPRAPTPATADNDTSIATTAFVKNQGYATVASLGDYVIKSNGTNSLTATTDWRIAAATAAASDTLAMRFVSGGTFNTSRGAILELNGVNAAALPGAFRLLSGTGGASVIQVDPAGSLTVGPGNTTFTGDTLVAKSNAVAGVGTGGTLNGGVANYAAAGVGDVGLFSEHATGTVRLRPNGRTSAVGQMLVTVSGVTWDANTVWHSGNFTPGNYVLKTGDTMSGNLTITTGSDARTTYNAGSASMTTGTGTGGAFLGTLSNHIVDIYTNSVVRGTLYNSGEFRWIGGEMQSTVANAMRWVQGNYGAIWRQDGANLYLLFTASGDQYGSWNALRPVTVNVASGLTSIGEGLAFGSQVGASTTDLSNHIALYSTTMGFNVTSGRLNYVVPSANIHAWVVNGADKMSLSATQCATFGVNMVVADGDLYTYRTGGTTGVIFLNSAATRYLYWDGSSYILPSAPLQVGGQINSGGDVVAGGAVRDSIGNVREIPQVAGNASAAFVATDAGKHKIKSSSTARTYTIPTNASVDFAIGTAITIVNLGGTTNNITVTPAGGVTVYRFGASGAFTVAPGNMVTLLKVGTNSWQA